MGIQALALSEIELFLEPNLAAGMWSQTKFVEIVLVIGKLVSTPVGNSSENGIGM